MTLQTRTVDWPVDHEFALTLDLECDYGTALSENTYQALEAVPNLVSLLERFDIPLTCFVQTAVLEAQPAAVEALQGSSIEVRFHPHSHTHQRREESDMATEVETSTTHYRAYFGRDPVGYRFPNGNVRRTDYELLASTGYAFDASVFPSWRPNHFNNARAPTRPQYLPEFDLFEIPFTVLSQSLRVPTALSYRRLIGRPYEWLLQHLAPPIVIYNIHMHDLVTPDRYADLSRLYRMVYGRNDRGFTILEDVIDEAAAAGYSFTTIDAIHDSLREDSQATTGRHSR